MSKKRKKFKMPGAFFILFLITILAVIATWSIPAGQYAKLSYSNSSFTITSPTGQNTKVPATQQELNKLGVKIKINQFTLGSINKPISIPNTYQRLKQHPASIFQITESMVQGTIQSADIMVFIFMLGGLIGIVKASGAFNTGLYALTQKTKGHEFLLIFLVSILMMLGGTLCGIEEEAVAFYPILVPIFIAMGYDSIVCIGAIFLAAQTGTAFSTINPFSVVIASNAAGINFTEGLNWRIVAFVFGALFVISYLYWYSNKVKNHPDESYAIDDKADFLKLWEMKDSAEVGPFTLKKKIILTLFAIAFPLMVYGVMAQGWWFPQMASSFLTIAVIIMFIVAMGKNGIGSTAVIDEFVQGAQSLLGVSLIIGLARGINIVLTNGMISDTILHYFSTLVTHVGGVAFVIMMLLIFFLLGFIVPSSSGLAVLSMPIFAPLADSVNVPRYVIVTAYQFGQYAMLFLAPTGLIMASLEMLHLKYSHWLKFVWPLVLFLLVFGGCIVVTETLMA